MSFAGTGLRAARQPSGLQSPASVNRNIHTPWLGVIEWAASAELLFPLGLPGFENEQRILPVEIPLQRPLIYLQSLERPSVCFLSLPVLTIDPAFRLTLLDEDLLTLGLQPGVAPVLGEDVLCLALLVPVEDTVEANLAAPVVINLHRGVGAQCRLQQGPRRFRLDTRGWAQAC